MLSAIVFALATPNLLLFVTPATGQTPTCLSPYQQCSSGDCALSPNACGTCSSGQYICPIGQNTCVDTVDDYVNCPGIKGTHLDWSLSIEDRLSFLINNLTLDEKYTQLTNDAPEIYRLGIPSFNWLNDDEHGVRQHHATTFPDGCGLGGTWSKHVLRRVGNIIAYEARSLYNSLVESGDRGHGENGHTITAYAPNMNLVRDPRWGRAQEVYSEDPRLTGRLTYEFVSGLQKGGKQNDTYMLMAACCKHYAAYDIEDQPTDRVYFDANVDSRNWQETYSPAFYSCIHSAKGAHVMCSYNSVNGVPACGNTELLTDVLRDQWNFTGFVVSDYDAMAQIYETHKYASSYEEAVSIALKAGCDQEGGGTNAIDQIPNAINDGLLTMDDVNTAFKRLFGIRFKLGLFDPPTYVQYNYLQNDSSVEGTEHLKYARQVAGESIGLYKNDVNSNTNKASLPLDASNVKKIAVIGPQAINTELLLGNYESYPDKGVPPVLQALREALGENKTEAQCTTYDNVDYYQPGQGGITTYNAAQCCNLCFQDDLCNYWTFYQSQCYLKQNNTGKTNSAGRISGDCQNSANANGTSSKVVFELGCTTVPCNTLTLTSVTNLINNNMNDLDMVIVFIGLDQSIESEGHDRTTIDLPGEQESLVLNISSMIKSHNIPLTCIMIHGGTLKLTNIMDSCNVILDAWYPGSMGAYGISDVIFGNVNPAGRASVTYYSSDDDLPTPGEMDLYADNGVTYRYYKGNNKPIIPFGYGLSYTTFEYESIKTDKTTYDPCDVINVTVKVKNTGNVDGDEVIQLYVTQPEATVQVPQVRLGDFERVFIERGETLMVSLYLTPKFHSVVYNSTNATDSWWNPNTYIEKGNINIYVGGGQPQYYDGALTTTVMISSSAKLNTCDNQD